MAINATASSFEKKELIPASNYVARCYMMIHIGTITEVINGKPVLLNKVRIGWELPTEQRVFSEEKGEQPFAIYKEYTLSMYDKSNLRKTLASWRGKDFSEEEAKCFDITKLLGVTCMLNIIHKPSKDGTRMYEEIGSVSPMPKGFDCPPQINSNIVLEYDNFNYSIYNSLPNFIKEKINKSKEYIEMNNKQEILIQNELNDTPPF